LGVFCVALDTGTHRENAMTPLSLRQRSRRTICGVIGLVLFVASAGRAQDYPNRTVTIVAPSAPGGMYSILARLTAASSSGFMVNRL
jgi:tripartite-type tricarboxylate transporter receptor subunit TctC